jgi:uncharacterized protein YdaU (DUF1376 family)
MHHFRFHIGDYRGATAHLTNEEDLTYRRLIEMYYDREGPLPLETQWVSKRVRVPVEMVEQMLSEYFVATNDGWRHPRCDQDIADYHTQVEKNRTNGKLGGRPRKVRSNGNPLGLSNNPLATHSQPTGNPLESQPVTSNQNPTTVNQGRGATPYSGGFEVWWKVYPRRVGKGEAFKAWKKGATSSLTRHAIMKATAELAAVTKDVKFVPNPATWLNQRRWEDDQSHSAAAGRGSKQTQQERIEQSDHSGPMEGWNV